MLVESQSGAVGRVCGMPDSVALTVLLQSYVEPCTHGVLLSCRTTDTRHDPGGGGAGGGVGPAVAVMHRPSPVLSSVSLKAQVWVGGLAGSQAASFTSPVPSTVRHLAERDAHASIARGKFKWKWQQWGMMLDCASGCGTTKHNLPRWHCWHHGHCPDSLRDEE